MKGVYIFLGIAAVAWIYAKSQPSPVVFVVPNSPPTTSGLDQNKILKRGTTGEEVKELQRRLGMSLVDGIFGLDTEVRLRQVKNVSEITLHIYNIT